VAKYQEFYRGVLMRKPNLLGEDTNMTPPLGIAMHIDPELQEKPVIELVRLSMDMGRSVYISFQDDVKLAVWDPKERDGFFDKAERGGMRHLFRNSRLEHKANVIAATNLLSGHVVHNMHQAIAGKIEPSSKEMDAGLAKEMLDLSYNEITSKADAILDVAAGGKLSPTAFGYALERVMRVADDFMLHKSPTELFQSIMMSNQQLCDALMDSMKDGSSFIRNLVNQGSEWADREKYFRNGFRDFNILTAERHSLEFADPNKRNRAANDFSGDFDVKTDLWTPGGEIERHFNVLGAARHGFDVGPSNFRRYDNMAKQILNGAGWKEAESLLKDGEAANQEDTRHPILKGTPPDLPLALAQNRLNMIEGMPGSEDSVVELEEIVDAESNSRELNLSVFRPASINMKTAESMIENHTIDQLEDLWKQKESVVDNLLEEEPGNAPILNIVEADEAHYWLEQHPDYEGGLSPEPALQGPS
jgi:hypothetical protein